MTQPVITIDGGAGTGTSSLANSLAQELEVAWLNCGSIYRGFTYRALSCGIRIDRHQGIHPDDISRLLELVVDYEVDFKDGEVHVVNGEPIGSRELARMSPFVPHVGAVAQIRPFIRTIQHGFAASHPFTVAEGRDLGTVVFPRAVRKIFLTCSPVERARRRSNHEGRHITVDEVLQRDALDASRDHSPMEAHTHALTFDTTNTSVPDLVTNIINSLRGVPMAQAIIAAHDQRQSSL